MLRRSLLIAGVMGLVVMAGVTGVRWSAWCPGYVQYRDLGGLCLTLPVSENPVAVIVAVTRVIYFRREGNGKR